MNLSKQCDEIMERFNFDRVLTAMHALNWTWIGETVTIESMHRTARSLMDTAIDNYKQETGWTSAATGGFEARIDIVNGQPQLSLSFYIDSKSGSLR